MKIYISDNKYIKLFQLNKVNGGFMSLSVIILISLALAIILGGVLLLKKSARKFDLTTEQLESIKKRNKALDEEEQKD